MAATDTTRPPQRGDEPLLYEQHADRLVAAVRRACSGDHVHIEDACQHAWLQLLRFQPDRRSIFAWLRTTAIREVWDTTARQRRDFDHLDGRPEPAIDTLSDQVRAREALTAITTVHHKHREVLTLNVAGYSYAETAQQLGVTHTYVRRQLARGWMAIHNSPLR